MHFGRAREAIWTLLETALIPVLFLLQRDDMLISSRPIVSQEGPVDEGLTMKTDWPSEAAMLPCYSRLLAGYSWRAEKPKPKLSHQQVMERTHVGSYVQLMSGMRTKIGFTGGFQF